MRFTMFVLLACALTFVLYCSGSVQQRTGRTSLACGPGTTYAMCGTGNLPAGNSDMPAIIRGKADTVHDTDGVLSTPDVKRVACPSGRLLLVCNTLDSSGQWCGSLYALSLADGSLTALNSHTDISGSCYVDRAGTRVVFQSLSPDNSFYTMNLDGSNLVNIAPAYGWITFSPDGSKVALGNGQAIDQVSSFGGPLTQIADLTAEGIFPCELAYSPDGRTIAFDDWTGLIGAVNVRTGRYTQLVNATDGSCYATPQYSPDGHEIIFSANGNTSAIMTMNANGNHVATLVSNPTPWTLWSPQYSPDGTKVAFYDSQSISIVDAKTGANRINVLPAGVLPANNEGFSLVGWIR